MEYCPPEIKEGAELLIVGEAPGREEVAAGRPFVGKSGQVLDHALKAVKLDRSLINIVNVSHHRPKDNEIKHFFPKGKPSKEIEEGVAFLKETIARTKPKAILAVGNTSLWALCGLRDISVRRGSVYMYEDIPVVATIHPAFVLRKPTLRGLFIFDVGKFREVARHGRTTPRPRELVINPTEADLSTLRSDVLRSEWVSVDIENYSHSLACVGFATGPDRAYCVPYTYGSRPEYDECIRSLLSGQTPKVFHNAPYDVPYLRHKVGLPVCGELHDTLGMQRALYPELPASLSVLTSLYTSTPYYKDEGEDWEADLDWDKFWRYNAMDCAVTIECAEVLRSKLKKLGLWDVYEMGRRVLPHALRMSERGLRYDTQEAQRLRARTERSLARRQKVLNGRLGYELNVNSHAKVKTALKEHGLSVPDTEQKTLLSALPLAPTRKARKIIRGIIYCRRESKFISTYLGASPSADGRIRTTLNPFGTETGRWSGGLFLITEGANLQTVPPAWKSTLKADDGKVFWMADYSQIEARIVAYLAEDKRAISIFEDPNGDIHRENSAVIFGKAPADVTDMERYVGKTGVHALNYGIGAGGLADSINKRALETGIFVDRPLAKKVRDAYISKFDALVAWQDKVWAEGKKAKRMTNPFGRRRIFTGPLTGIGAEHTKGEMLAFFPQSSVPDLLNLALCDLCDNPPCEGFEVLLNIHDALMGQGPAELVELWAPAIRKAMSIPFEVNGHTITIPVEIKVGDRWSNMRKV